MNNYYIPLKLTIQPDKRLHVSLAEPDNAKHKAELAAYLADDLCSPIDTWCAALDYWGGPIGNGWYYVTPEDAGALTDDPYMLTNSYFWDDHGNVVPEEMLAANVWYYPRYQTTDIFQEIADNGFAVMELASNG